MARIFVTGSVDGLGRAAAQSLLDAGHQVILHARSNERGVALGDLAPRARAVVVGDLGSAAETLEVAEQVNRIGGMDAVIHNAGVYAERSRGATPEGHARTLAVNVLAPYMLTARMERPSRLVYLSSGLHRGGVGSLQDVDWIQRPWDAGRAYSESKLYIVALALALARRWPDVHSNAVDPGWVRTRMGGRNATVDVETGARTQAWLAVSEDAAAKVSGRYWHNMHEEQPAKQATDPRFQDELIATMGNLTGERMP